MTDAGADVVRIAVDSRKDADALREIRRQTTANLAVDLQENYRLAESVAPYVDKIRYNPGHLYHHERERSWQDKVRYLVQVATEYDCALRVGVNCGSVDPDKRAGTRPRTFCHPCWKVPWTTANGLIRWASPVTACRSRTPIRRTSSR